jgi:hypothetical protein
MFTTPYPPPEKNPACRCYVKGDAASFMRAMFCPYGHMTECHYPMTCAEAECGHWEIERESEEEADCEFDFGGGDP